MKRKGTAEWRGGLKDGKGTVSTESNTLHNIPYSFHTRFEEGQGTNPEELIAAAHAGCFSMALSAQLEKEGIKAEQIKTTATVTLEKSAEGFSIPAVHLEVVVKASKANQDSFDRATKNAKEGCPVSKLLKANITMNASLIAES